MIRKYEGKAQQERKCEERQRLPYVNELIMGHYPDLSFRSQDDKLGDISFVCSISMDNEIIPSIILSDKAENAMIYHFQMPLNIAVRCFHNCVEWRY